MQRFQQTTNSDVARWIARACLIAPSNGTDFEAVKRLADVALTADTNRWVAGIKALAEYRAGRFETALEWAQRSVRAPGFDHDANLQVEIYAVLAMAHVRLRHERAAQAALNEGIVAETGLPKLEGGDLGGGAFSWIIAHALLREAKALIEGESPAANKQSETIKTHEK